MALPSGYTQLKHIESTGTQYINTGHVIVSENMRVVMQFCYTGTHSDSTLFGSETAGITGSGEYSICPYGNPTQFFVGGSKAMTSAYTPAVNEDCTLEVTAKNGTLIEVWNKSTTQSRSYVQHLNHTYSVFLFANNISGSAKQLCPIRLYSWRLYDNDTLVRDYVPAMRDSDSVVGLYDLQNSVFYTNAGSGNFRYKRFSSLPSGYTQLESITSNGSQYINTGFTPNQNTRVVCDVQWTPPSASSSNYLFGARSSGSSNKFAINGYGGKYESHYAGNTVYMQSGISTRFIIDKNKNVTTFNGTAYTHSATTFTCPGPLYLFAMNNNGSVYANSSATMYSCQIYNNGTLVRDFIPAKRNSDRAIGLYDLENGVFYTNAGSGTFTAGPEIVADEHKTMVDGTVYDVLGGRVMVGGTLYDLLTSRTMADGTAYTIPFKPKPILVTLVNGGMGADYAHVTINGVTYGYNNINSGSSVTIEVEVGTRCECAVYYLSTTCYVKLNGTTVASGKNSAGGFMYYTHTINEPTTITLNVGLVNITTQ